MKSSMLSRLFAFLLPIFVLALPVTARADKKGCVDPSLFPTRMPGYEIANCETSAFEGYDFYTPKGPKHREEGTFTFVTYQLVRGETEASGIAVIRNYENAFKALGGTIVATDPKGNWWTNGKVTIDGKEVWFQVEKGNGRIWLRIIEKTAMEQHVVADAAAIHGDLKRTGHVAIEGIYFDTNKATIKKVSFALLNEVAQALKDNPKIEVEVQGHTDSQGNDNFNMKLSQNRANSVRAYLMKQGVEANRMTAMGYGENVMIADNRTAEGRAQNRRVEFIITKR